jgi:hypothetical protein
MKPNLILISLLYLLISFSQLYSQTNKFGLGIILGEPTGISGKYWLEEKKAIDFALGYGLLGDKSRFSLHVDYLYHTDNDFIENLGMPVYYGFGVRLRTHSSERGSLGVRGVMGVLQNLDKYPVEIFLEVVPVFQLLPETKLKLDAAIGGRYYFPSM